MENFRKNYKEDAEILKNVLGELDNPDEVLRRISEIALGSVDQNLKQKVKDVFDLMIKKKRPVEVDILDAWNIKVPEKVKAKLIKILAKIMAKFDNFYNSFNDCI